MKALNLPKADLKIVQDKGTLKIFDFIRKKYLVLTPEEWVRQNFIHFLVGHRGFPKGLLKMESGVKYYQRKGRYDAVFLDRSGKPLLLIECKAPEIKIDNSTLGQVARYNSRTKAPFLALTNGIQHYFIKVEFLENKLIALSEMPTYEYLASQNDSK